MTPPEIASPPVTIACFISPHGFGHAARASAVLQALLARFPALTIDLFTQVPPWFFELTLTGHFNYHSLLTDIGMAQKNSLTEDAAETARRLDEFLPFTADRLQPVVAQLQALDCRLALCDISPLGIAAARQAGIPAVLVENFTWDWIYQGYTAEEPRLDAHAGYLRDIFAAADYRIQTEPYCAPAPAHLRTPPVSRSPRTAPAQIRQALGIPAEAKAVLLTMGGIRWDYGTFHSLEAVPDCYFIIPGPVDAVTLRGNLALLPHRSQFFHPDLVNAVDAVVGKVGYSTLAEVYHAGIPFGYISREAFKESAVLVDYVLKEMRGIWVDPARFERGDWVAQLPDLLALPRLRRECPNGADMIADFVGNLL